MRRNWLSIAMLVLAAVLAAAPVAAQEATEAPAGEQGGPLPMPETIVPENAILTGLNSPRGLSYGEDGTLYIAESGFGGDQVLMEMEGTSITGGLTSQVTALAPDGTSSAVVPFLTSASVGPESLGLHRVYAQGDSLWLIFSETQNMTVFSDAVVEIDPATLRVKNYIELYAFEAANNPDGTEEIYSNPSDLAWGPDGTLYIVDTGANAVYSWTEDAGLAVWKAWTDGPVPTAIEIGEDGSVWLGFLGAGIAPGAARVERYEADSTEPAETFDGLTAVTDILLADDGTVYAVQLISSFGEMGPEFNSGSVLAISNGEVTPVAEGLPQPFGIAQSPDGQIVVSVNAAFAAPGSGAIVPIDAGM